jgi:uncharacterized iron-regulated membrane protein
MMGVRPMTRWATNRKLHRWGAVIAAAPLLVVIVTGILLQLKKEIGWIQPPTRQGGGDQPTIGFDEIYQAARSVPRASVDSWKDIERIDVQPRKGLIKVHARNRWEIQLDARDGSVLQVAYRRSDLIESLHDGSWFHERAKLAVFLPAAAVLLAMWISGIVLFLQPYVIRRRRQALRRELE